MRHAATSTMRGWREDVKPGDRILIDDGLIELHVREVNGTDIVLPD